MDVNDLLLLDLPGKASGNFPRSDNDGATAANNNNNNPPARFHTIPFSKTPSSDPLWTILLNHATDILGTTTLSSKHSPPVAMEVGMHSATQCLEAAAAGLHVHCVEPSPASFQRVLNQVDASPHKARVSLYQKAASSTSQGTVNFKSSGGTGDHVGEFDMWRMKANTDLEHFKGQEKIVQVPQIRLDDIVQQQIIQPKQADSVFALKIDTQGFEPFVLEGLSQSLVQHQIKFLLMEYWPRGIDLHAGTPDACSGVKMLQHLVTAGYTLYALAVHAHPKAPYGYQTVLHERPLDDLQANCLWYLKLEQQFPSEEYKMGYWSDVLAVAPNFGHSHNNQTEFAAQLGRWLRGG
eukprot:scaffold1007_cov176-Amphora_coffeaeformis.AAC.5